MPQRRLDEHTTATGDDAAATLAVADLEALPEGLGEEYRAQMERLLPGGLRASAPATRVLAAIVAAAEPPRIDSHLPALSGVPADECLAVVRHLSLLFPVVSFPASPLRHPRIFLNLVCIS